MQYLGKSKESWIERFLQEAQSLMKSDDITGQKREHFKPINVNIQGEVHFIVNFADLE